MQTNTDINTVIIDLKSYNELRDFRKNIIENKVVKFFIRYNNISKIHDTSYLTENEAVLDLIKIAEQNEVRFDEYKKITEKELADNKQKILEDFEQRYDDAEEIIKLKQEVASLKEHNDLLTKKIIGLVDTQTKENEKNKSTFWNFLKF